MFVFDSFKPVLGIWNRTKVGNRLICSDYKYAYRSLWFFKMAAKQEQNIVTHSLIKFRWGFNLFVLFGLLLWTDNILILANCWKSQLNGRRCHVYQYNLNIYSQTSDAIYKNDDIVSLYHKNYMYLLSKLLTHGKHF